MLKKISYALITSLLIIMVLATIHDIALHYYSHSHNSVNFGITTQYTGLLFSVLLISYNIYIRLNKGSNYLIGLLILITCSILPLKAIQFYPYKASFLITLIFAGLSTKPFIL